MADYDPDAGDGDRQRDLSWSCPRALRALLDGRTTRISMRGQRGLGDCPDYVLCDLLRGRLLVDNCVLTCLDLSQTGIVVTKELAECFRGNITLREIILEHNNIPDAGIGSLASALEDSNVGWVGLAGNCCRLSDGVLDSLEAVLSMNRRPQNLILTVTAHDTSGPRLEVRAHDLGLACHDVAYAEPSMPIREFAKTALVRIGPGWPDRNTKVVLLAQSGQRLRHMDGTVLELATEETRVRLRRRSKPVERVGFQLPISSHCV